MRIQTCEEVRCFSVLKCTIFQLQIFTERPQNELPSERLRPETVIDYLHRFPKAVITYLEYLVFQKKLEVSLVLTEQMEVNLYTTVWLEIMLLN